MHPLFWPLLDALQGGALFALTLYFGADAWVRRDRVMVFLTVCCLAIGLRHGVLAFGEFRLLDELTADRAQSLLASFGFIAVAGVVQAIFPRQLPRSVPVWLAAGLLPNFVRNLLLFPGHPLDAPLHTAANLVYLAGLAWIISGGVKARAEGDPMAPRFFYGVVAMTVPVAAEVVGLFFGTKLRLSGLALILLATTLGASWQWLLRQGLEARWRAARTEADAWRSLVPGPAWRSDQPSPYMETLFGADWASRVAERMQGLDGALYRARTAELERGVQVGWMEEDTDTLPGVVGGFLSGWTLAVGLDGDEARQVTHWLTLWGAEIEPWGTLPPREGPYPSVLIWGREPSILAVWREDDLTRRRPRWIQLGGPITEGPHARLERPLGEAALREALQRLLSLR